MLSRLHSSRPSAVNLLIHEEPTIFAVTADRLLSGPLQTVAKSRRVRLQQHESAAAFFRAYDPKQPGCLIWDTAVDGPGERNLFERLARRKIRLPVVFVSDAVDMATIVTAMKAGALNYLQKPPEREAIWQAVSEAVAWDAQNRVRLRRAAKIRRRLGLLSPGESEVLELLLEGSSNREIAGTLGLSVRTIEVRRAKLMKKMKARSLPELVRLAIAAENGPR